MTVMNSPRSETDTDLPASLPSAGSDANPADRRAVGPEPWAWHDGFVHRHIGPHAGGVREMLAQLGYDAMDAFISDVIPDAIRRREPLELAAPAGTAPRGEYELLGTLRRIAAKNQVWRSCLGMGYHGTITPPVVLRNVMENPSWYTQYTPYQAEISQGRLELLLNFQTMIADLTGLPIANASLLDEGTAAAEAMAMAINIAPKQPRAFFAADHCHPQTLGVLRTRCGSMGVELTIGDPFDERFDPARYAGVLVQYPDTSGVVHDYHTIVRTIRDAGAVTVMAADPLALTLLKPPGELGADIAIGSVQRFGVPMGGGGPHAAYMATHESNIRKMPGRIVGVSKDANG